MIGPRVLLAIDTGTRNNGIAYRFGQGSPVSYHGTIQLERVSCYENFLTQIQSSTEAEIFLSRLNKYLESNEEIKSWAKLFYYIEVPNLHRRSPKSVEDLVLIGKWWLKWLDQLPIRITHGNSAVHNAGRWRRVLSMNEVIGTIEFGHLPIEKARAFNYCQMTTGIVPKNSHEADALCMLSYIEQRIVANPPTEESASQESPT